PWIQHHVHLGSHGPEYVRGLLHALLRDVCIHVAAAKEYRRPIQRTGIGEVRARWTDQPAAEAQYTSKCTTCTCLTRGILRRQTRALGETADHYAIRWNAGFDDPLDHCVQPAKCGGEPGLVELDRLQEAMRKPGVGRRLRCERGHSRPGTRPPE